MLPGTCPPWNATIIPKCELVLTRFAISFRDQRGGDMPFFKDIASAPSMTTSDVHMTRVVCAYFLYDFIWSLGACASFNIFIREHPIDISAAAFSPSVRTVSSDSPHYPADVEASDLVTCLATFIFFLFGLVRLFFLFCLVDNTHTPLCSGSWSCLTETTSHTPLPSRGAHHGQSIMYMSCTCEYHVFPVQSREWGECWYSAISQ